MTTNFNKKGLKRTDDMDKEGRILLHVSNGKIPQDMDIPQSAIVEKTKKENVFMNSTLPFDEATINRYYLIGVNSIIKNLPKPNVKLIKGHAYISVRQCISDFLGKGMFPQLQSINSKRMVKHLIDSPIIGDVYKRAILKNPGVDANDLFVLVAIQWSDNFEPNTSNKSN